LSIKSELLSIRSRISSLHHVNFDLNNLRSHDYACECDWAERELRLSITVENPENPVINCLRRLSDVNTGGRERESPWVKALAKVRVSLAEVFPHNDAARRQFSQFCGDCTAGVTLQV